MYKLRTRKRPRRAVYRAPARQFRLEPLERRLLMADTRPNFVVIYTDDQRYDTLDFMPITMAELSLSGTTFENAFVPTATCCPSRASLLSGQYAHNTGVLYNEPQLGGFENFNDNSTLATWLQDAGYRTGLVGKYLNSYDDFSPYNVDQQNTYVAPGWDDWQAFLGAGYYNYAISNNGVAEEFPGSVQNYSTDILAGKAVNFIQTSEASDEQPFFLYFTPHAPHAPANPAQRHVGMFNNIEPFRPPSFNEADVSDKPLWLQNRPLLTAEEIAENDTFREKQLESLQAVDEAVGELMDTLRATGELERTVVIFASDNGLTWGEHRYANKSVAYEESIRIPLIIRDGRNPLQQSASAMALNIDLAPTIAGLAGVAIPNGVDGQSLTPSLVDPSFAGRDDFLIEHFRSDGVGQHFALRTNQWKYVEYRSGDRELYDLVNDPYELQSRHAEPGLAGMIAQFSARIAQLKSQDVTGPLTSEVTAPPWISAGSLTFTAMASDVSRGNNQIRTPEYFIDVLGPASTGEPMFPHDRSWSSGPTELVAATIDATVVAALSPGVHTIYVRSRDVAGNWGPPTSTTFFVGTPPPFMLGDMNGDENLDNFDLQPLELALTNVAQYRTLFPHLTDYAQRGDINDDSAFNNFDIQPLERALTEGLPQAPFSSDQSEVLAGDTASGTDAAPSWYSVDIALGLAFGKSTKEFWRTGNLDGDYLEFEE